MQSESISPTSYAIILAHTQPAHALHGALRVWRDAGSILWAAVYNEQTKCYNDLVEIAAVLQGQRDWPLSRKERRKQITPLRHDGLVAYQVVRVTSKICPCAIHPAVHCVGK